MKIGLIICAYNCQDTIEECLRPWVELNHEGVELEFAVVSVRFNTFPERENITTIKKLMPFMLQTRGVIMEYPTSLSETDCRNMGLTYLLDKKVDLVWILDADELYTKDQILKTIKRVEENPLTVWWRIPFKNYIFEGKHWIDGFCPPRIFRVSVGDKILSEFYWDNDVNYKNIEGDHTFDYQTLASSMIPKGIAHVRHLTWLHSNSKAKIEHQLAHYKQCSYQWNETEQKVELSTEFYKTHNQPLPIIEKDTE